MASVQWVQLPFAFVSPGEVLAAGILFPLVTIGLSALRFHIRVTQKAPFGIDDWCSALGSIFITGMGACFIAGERLGVFGYPTPLPYGKSAEEAYGLFLDSYTLTAKLEFAIQFLLVFAYLFVKASIVFFCRRIFVGHKNSVFDWASKAVLVIIGLWSVGFLLTLIFGCGKHVEIHWAPLQQVVASGCDVSTPEVALVISDLLIDIIILLLPLPSIWTLNMSSQKKLAITGVFLVGLAAIAATAARAAVYLTVLYDYSYGAGYDIDQTVTLFLYWSMLEASLAGITASLPTLSLLAKDIRVQAFFQRLSSMSNFSGSWFSRKSSSERSEDIHKETDYTMDSMHKTPSNTSQKDQSESRVHIVEA